MNMKRKKLFKRIRNLFGFALTVILLTTALGIAAYAETMDIIPNGTNIPDTNIGGATSTSPFATDPFMSDTSRPATESNSVSNGTSGATSPMSPAETAIGSDTSAIVNPDTSDSLGGILGVIIAVIVVLAVIMLIITLVPRRAASTAGNSGRSDTDSKNRDNK